jgi:hypothetical protein
LGCHRLPVTGCVWRVTNVQSPYSNKPWEHNRNYALLLIFLFSETRKGTAKRRLEGETTDIRYNPPRRVPSACPGVGLPAKRDACDGHGLCCAANAQRRRSAQLRLLSISLRRRVLLTWRGDHQRPPSSSHASTPGTVGGRLCPSWR